MTLLDLALEGRLSWGVLAALAGLISGLMLGLAARLGDFCTLGALESALYNRDTRRLRLWGVVLGTAVFAVDLSAAQGLIDLKATYYHAIRWNPLASILGGLVFGYGMALAGNCGFGALVRFGGGDIRSLVVVVVMGIAGFVALSGPLGPLRAWAFPQPEALSSQTIAETLTFGLPLSPQLVARALGVGLVLWGLAHPGLRAAPRQVVWGVVAGLAVAWALAATSWLAAQSMGVVPVEGPSYTAPVGRTILFLMTASAGGITFSVGSVLGTALGAFCGSLLRGLFRWEACDDPRELGRQMAGAALMGLGGVVAMGCSIGQGLTGFATLAWSGPVTLAAIVAGAAFGLNRLVR